MPIYGPTRKVCILKSQLIELAPLYVLSFKTLTNNQLPRPTKNRKSGAKNHLCGKTHPIKAKQNKAKMCHGRRHVPLWRLYAQFVQRKHKQCKSAVISSAFIWLLLPIPVNSIHLKLSSLPQEVVMSPSVKAFEARLDRFWKDQPMMFDYKEELRL